MILKDKKIVLGITGSIAAYRVFELIKLLKNAGACVFPVLTKNAQYFVTPLSIEIACENKVLCDMFESPMAHIELARSADLFAIVPATANYINKYAYGIADDLITTASLAFRGPVVIAPAMNWRMYESHQVQRSIENLKNIGVHFVEPDEGSLACGEEGKGRLASPSKIFETIVSALTEKDLKGERIIVTAGPTRHYIDSIRFITNKSSGKMGYALALAAARRGAEVTLISGPTNITPPYVGKFTQVETTQEMLKSVIDESPSASILIMAAAPLDFEPSPYFDTKVDKTLLKSISLKLCPDILKETAKIKNRPFTVGFAAEAGLNIERAKQKFKEKSLHMIVLNDVTGKEGGMGADNNQIIMLYKRKNKFHMEKTNFLSKEEIANIILSKIKELRVER